jgi:hypothetical protein
MVESVIKDKKMVLCLTAHLNGEYGLKDVYVDVPAVLGARGVGIRAVWFNRFGLPRPGPDEAAELRSLRPLGRARKLLLGTAGHPATGGLAPPPREL